MTKSDGKRSGREYGEEGEYVKPQFPGFASFMSQSYRYILHGSSRPTHVIAWFSPRPFSLVPPLLAPHTQFGHGDPN